MNIRSTATFRPGNIAAIMDRTMASTIEGTTKGAQRVLDSALEKVAVDTGELQSSGHLVVTWSGHIVTGSVIFDAPHAAYVEFGTGIRGASSPGAGIGISYSPTWPGMPAQPYARPALDENQDAILGDFTAAGFKAGGSR